MKLPPDLWRVERVAEFLGLDVETVRHGRAGTQDIPRLKMGRSVGYDPRDVIAWREERRRRSQARIDRRRDPVGSGKSRLRVVG